MRTYTRVRCEWNGQRYVMVDCDSFLYSGPVALCDRGTSKAVANQQMQQSAQDQAAATSALSSTNADLASYTKNLNNFMKFGRDTYGTNGEFMRDQNTLANTTAAAGGNAIKGNLALNAMRTGENTSGYAGTVKEAQQENEQNLTNELASADSQRLANLTNLEQFGVQASALPAQIQQGIYGSSIGGATGAGGNAANAAKTPGFWDTFLPAVVGAAGTAAAGFCPCEGSQIRMADGTTKAVENLRAGDMLWSGSLTPPNPVLEDTRPHLGIGWKLRTKGGLEHSGSDTHTLGLARGGYAYMPELLGAVVIGELNSDVVESLGKLGSVTVYPIKLGGSHCYFADGLYCLA